MNIHDVLQNNQKYSDVGTQATGPKHGGLKKQENNNTRKLPSEAKVNNKKKNKRYRHESNLPSFGKSGFYLINNRVAYRHESNLPLFGKSGFYLINNGVT